VKIKKTKGSIADDRTLFISEGSQAFGTFRLVSAGDTLFWRYLFLAEAN